MSPPCLSFPPGKASGKEPRAGRASHGDQPSPGLMGFWGNPSQVSPLQRAFMCVFWAGSICPAVCPASSRLESGGRMDMLQCARDEPVFRFADGSY